jgi:pimeloyl-ACP methyl ester carboxylesterase
LEEGKGPLVLLLHGFPDTAHTWDDVRPKIAAKGYRVVTPFMRGYAPTEVPREDATLETLARDALGLIEALGEKQAIVIGHDWGAVTAYGAAALGGDRVTKLITVAIPHPAKVTFTPKLLWGTRHFIAYKFPGAASRFAAGDFAALRAIYKRWSPAWTPPEEEFGPVKECFADRASLDAAFGYYRALSFVTPKHLRPKIDVPTVVFAGTDDPQVGPSDYEPGRAMFTKEYTIESMPGGHFLHREHPAIFAERLLAHL